MLLIAGGDVVTMNPSRDVLVGGCVAVEGERIASVGRTGELRSRYPTAEVLDASGCVVTPGLVNAHQHHTGDPLCRSCIPDRITSHDAVFGWAVPLHMAHTPDDEELSAVLTAVECVRSGITTVVEAGTVVTPERVAAGMARVGIRGTIGVWGWDVGDGPLAGPAGEVLDRQRQVLDRWPRGGLVEGWVTLVGHDLASDELLAGAAALATQRGVGMTMHLSPSRADPESYLARHGCRPVVHLDRLGVLGHHLLIGHGVWLDDEEVELVLATESAIAYCPWAYVRLAQGAHVGRHAEIVSRGGRVALGADAANAGDHADILRAAALFAGLARDLSLDPMEVSAALAFELATIRGAEAIGMADRIGSLESGKKADVVVHRTDVAGWMPRGDVALQLVWGTDGRSVRDVLVDGRFVVRDGVVLTVDVADLHERAAVAQRELLARSRLTVPHAWPHLLSH